MVSDCHRTHTCFRRALIPGRVRTYTLDGLRSAIDWLAATGKGAHLSYRALHDQGVLVIEPKGPLSDADFDRLAAVVDPWIEGAGDLKGLVIHAAKFPGWEDLGSFLQHMRFVRGHHKKVARVALAMDGAMIQRLAGIGDHFIAAEVKPFATDDLDQAITWAAGTDAT